MPSGAGEPAARHRVVFTPSGRVGAVAHGTSLLDAARGLGVDLDSVCGGRGICGRCAVVPSLGSFPKWGIDAEPSALSPPGEAESSYRVRRSLSGDARLGCQTSLLGDAAIDVPPESQLHSPVVRKSVDVGGIQLDPLFTLHAVEVPQPDMETRGGLIELLADRLAAEWGVVVTRTAPAAITCVHDAASAAGGLVTAAVRRHASGAAADWSTADARTTAAMGKRASGTTGGGAAAGVLAAVWPGVVTSAFGVAVDVGSTTAAGHLVDLHSGEVLAGAGRMNPQIRLGEDLMSRVSYAMMHPDGTQELAALIREALGDLIAQLCESVGGACGLTSAEVRGRVLDIVLVGNPIMCHLLLGIDPSPLGQAPFTLATTEAVELEGAALGLDCPAAQVTVGPSIAGHVGADSTAAILACGPHRSDETMLMIDVGTNAEIVLGSKAGVWAASSPTGPAFEGAQTSSGQRAVPGAIERVRIDPATWAPRFTVIGSDLWSDDPDFAQAVERGGSPRAGGKRTGRGPRVGVTGICGSGIIEVVAEMFLAGVISADGAIAPPPDGSDMLRKPSDASAAADGATAPLDVSLPGAAPSSADADPRDPSDSRSDSADGQAGDMRSGRLRRDGRTWSYVLYEPPQDDGGPTVMVTQNDVRAIQLAKAALRAGIDLLCEHADVAEIDRIVLAGAFGAHIDPLRAMVLGMIPDCDPARVQAVGNAAGAGAVRALLSRRERAEMSETARRAVKVETATQPRFQELFVAAMALPHAEMPTPCLAQAVQLPDPRSSGKQIALGSAGSRRPRRRRRVSSRKRHQ